MNKTAIKNFAIWARNKLIADISYKAGLLGITEKGIKSPLPQSTQTVQFFDIGTKEPSSITGTEIQQRKKLVEEIERKAKQSDYSTAYKNVIEEVAYTWFNRLIAIRFMEVNDYLPTRIRVLSSESNGKAEPDLVTHALEANLDYTAYEKDRIIQLKHENKLDELFRMLFIKQCNALNANLPELFEKTNDYTELLLNVSFTDKEGMIYHLVTDIDETDWLNAVEIIGWLYQYYITEKHDEVIDPLRGKSIKKDDIPAATQLFTPDWIVRYMVDNSLGRLWVENNIESELAKRLEFYVHSKEIDIVETKKIEPHKITFFDPCMGSGHILVYAFDVLMEIYKESGYSERDAAISIVENNIFGLDIDNRASQLAYFAVMMKARSYDRRFLSRSIFPKVYSIHESNNINNFECEGITTNKNLNAIGNYLLNIFKHASEIGSLQSIQKFDYDGFVSYLNSCEKQGQVDILESNWLLNTKPFFIKLAIQAKILSEKYDVVCTNPPYLNKIGGHLKEFILEKFSPYSGDLFSVFIYRNFDFCKHDGFSALLTPNVWMSIKSFENLRRYIVENKNIVSLVQLAHNSFNEIACVDVCSFIMSNQNRPNKGSFIKLSDFKGDLDVQKKMVLKAINSRECDYLFHTDSSNFDKIPGCPITAYWASSGMINVYTNAKLLDDVALPKQGIATSNNDKFIRYWYEVQYNKLHFTCKTHEEAFNSGKKWFPYNKGGNFRKWYGNNDYVINWEYDGAELKNYKGSVLRNPNYYFRECISWSLISSYTIAFRYKPIGHLFDVAGMSCFSKNDVPLEYLLALNNSCLIGKFMLMLAPTINYQVGNIANIPVIYDTEKSEEISKLALENIDLAKEDWDSNEYSWDFKINPIFSKRNDFSTIEDAYNSLVKNTNQKFNQLSVNEELLNKIFLNIYNLEDEFSEKINPRDVSMTSIYENRNLIPNNLIESYYVKDKKRVVIEFISYVIGCIFGRYSPDFEGVAYAGGDWDKSRYIAYKPDADNIIPITDEEYFEDDIVGLFHNFISSEFGEETVEENFNFIANSLATKGDNPREVIRNYFLKDFFKDHCNIYQKRPIYWLFESGKQNGFKALIYMHRYDENTIGNLRVDYLHRMQQIFENEIARMQDTIENSRDTREVTAATKRKEKLIKQLQETKEYDEKIAHLALARTSIDLDDGVKVNYEKIQTDRDGKKLDVLAKI